MDPVICNIFYRGINDESKQMVDACAGGTLNSLTYKEAVMFFAERDFNEEQYNPLGEVESQKCILFINPELMHVVKKSMKEKKVYQLSWQLKGRQLKYMLW
jgi:hypothetical protein